MEKIKTLLNRFWKPLLMVTIVVLLVTIWTNNEVIKASENYITSDINKVETNNVGLLLGTSKKVKSGRNNQYFFNRIDATVDLYKKGKIKNVIISGDHGHKDYNEPLDMQQELIKGGIPDSVIYLDYAGFRTLDAVIRAKEIFGQNSFLVISQQFHNERAVFIARKLGINAFGYNAKEVGTLYGFRTKLREFFARDKVFFDLIFGVKAKYLGEKILIK
jgi:SanA protein